MISSVLCSPLIDSARALSKLSPTDPTEASILASEGRSLNAIDVYWVDSTGQCNSAASLSAGVSKSRVLRGREFRRVAVASAVLAESEQQGLAR